VNPVVPRVGKDLAASGYASGRHTGGAPRPRPRARGAPVGRPAAAVGARARGGGAANFRGWAGPSWRAAQQQAAGARGRGRGPRGGPCQCGASQGGKGGGVRPRGARPLERRRGARAPGMRAAAARRAAGRGCAGGRERAPPLRARPRSTVAGPSQVRAQLGRRCVWIGGAERGPGGVGDVFWRRVAALGQGEQSKGCGLDWRGRRRGGRPGRRARGGKI
jgi:hypothetical protein